MTHSGAQIIRAHMITLGLVSSHDTGSWRSFYSRMPDEPDNAVCFYDMEPQKQGRIIRTGEVIKKPRVMIQVRSKSFNDGWAKAQELNDAIEAIKRNEVTVAGTDEDPDSLYFLLNVLSEQGGASPLGQEDTNKKREYFSLNIKLSVEQREASAQVDFAPNDFNAEDFG